MSFLGLQGRWTSQYAFTQTVDTQTHSHMTEHQRVWICSILLYMAMKHELCVFLYVCVYACIDLLVLCSSKFYVCDVEAT